MNSGDLFYILLHFYSKKCNLIEKYIKICLDKNMHNKVHSKSPIRPIRPIGRAARAAGAT